MLLASLVDSRIGWLALACLEARNGVEQFDEIEETDEPTPEDFVESVVLRSVLFVLLFPTDFGELVNLSLLSFEEPFFKN